MKSITTTPNKYGWYYTFRKLNDGTIIIQQKIKDERRSINEIQVWGEEELKAFYEVLGG